MLEFNLRLFTAALAVALATGVAPQASASLVGDTVSCTAEFASDEFPLFCSPGSAVVTQDGVEFVLQSVEGPMTFNLVDVDPGAASITIENVLPGAIDFFAGDGVTLSDLDWVDDPSAVILGISNFTSNIGAVSSIVSSGPHRVTVDLSDLRFTENGFLSFDLVTGASAIPLPPTALLLVGGLAGIGWVKRRRRA